jgi:hypothetical protein
MCFLCIQCVQRTHGRGAMFFRLPASLKLSDHLNGFLLNLVWGVYNKTYGENFILRDSKTKI